MRKLLAAFAAATLLISSLFAASIAPVAAAGDCADAYVIFYKNANFGGASVKMCLGINDSNFTSLGPDANGVTHANWNNQLSSFKVRGAPGADQGVCLYRDENYQSLWHQSTATSDWNIDIFNNDETGSFKFAPISPISGRAAC